MQDPTPSQPQQAGCPPHPVANGPAADRSVSSMHRFVPYRDDEIGAETVVTTLASIGMLCFAGVLFAAFFDAGVLA